MMNRSSGRGSSSSVSLSASVLMFLVRMT